MTNIILWIVFGGIAGWIASMIMNTDEEQGMLGNIIVGIIGAFLGGWIVSGLTDKEGVSGFDLGSLVVAILGSVILLAIVKAFRRPHHTV